MAGDDPDQVLQSCCHGTADFRMDTLTLLHRYGAVCSAHGCHHCTNPGCPYAEFIRQYWSYPQFD